MMKKMVASLLVLLMLFGSMGVSAWAEPDAEVSGESEEVKEDAITAVLTDDREPGQTLSAGATLTLTLRIGGAGLIGAQGGLQYDPQKLTLVESRSLIDGWSVFVGAGKESFLVCSDTASDPIDAESEVCSFLFKLSEELQPGNEIEVKITGCTVTDGKQQQYPGDPLYARKIAPADSVAARLSSLSVGNYTLSPAFSPDVFDYTVSDLPAGLPTLTLGFVPLTPDLKITQYGDLELHGGKNIIHIALEAPDGSAAIYTITAIRAFDDDYIPSSDSALSAITLSAGTLSPAFSPEIFSYIVYLPNEAKDTVFTLGGKARDEKAQPVEDNTAVLGEGSNPITLLCVAESGDVSQYTVTVLVMPALIDGVLPYVNGVNSFEGYCFIEEQDDFLVMQIFPSRADASWTTVWYADDRKIGEGNTFTPGEKYRDKVITAVASGIDGFTGELEAQYVWQPKENHVIELDETTLVYGSLAAGGVLIVGITIGFFIGKAVYCRKKEEADE